MNREEKRKYLRNIQKKMVKDGVPKAEREKYLKYFANDYVKDRLENGDKVKIKYDDFMKRKEETNAQTNPKLLEWLAIHKDDIFTVEYEKAYEEKKILCCLREDETVPKWLFWTEDLEKVIEYPEWLSINKKSELDITVTE